MDKIATEYICRNTDIVTESLIVSAVFSTAFFFTVVKNQDYVVKGKMDIVQTEANPVQGYT